MALFEIDHSFQIFCDFRWKNIKKYVFYYYKMIFGLLRPIWPDWPNGAEMNGLKIKHYLAVFRDCKLENINKV